MALTAEEKAAKAAEKAKQWEDGKKLLTEWGGRISALTVAMERLSTAMEATLASKALGTGQ